MLDETSTPEEREELAKVLRDSAVPMEIQKNTPKNRMTVVIQLSHEMVRGGGPRGKRIVGSSYLESKDQSYERDFVLEDGEPQPFDKGWVVDSGFVGIEVYTADATLILEKNGVVLARVTKERPLVGDIPVEGATWRMEGAQECMFTVSVVPR